MSFVSYAQNFEDVMLWRALGHVENGCYVDVGAQHPVVDSVSKAFYDRGWRGIHVEPVPEYAQRLRENRPDETVLQMALSDVDGALVLNVIPDTGLSTAIDAYAQNFQAMSGVEARQLQVEARTMKTALAQLTGREVHWLKIDVEGFEEQVLKGWDSGVFRPWILVIEATVPNSRETDYARWEPIVTAAGYEFVYFDGLNRFYVAGEHRELIPAFSTPPNVFDRVQLSGLASSELCHRLLAAQRAREEEFAALTQARAQRFREGLESAAQSSEKLSHEPSGPEEGLAVARREAAFLALQLGDAGDHLSLLQAGNRRLQDELDAAKVKIASIEGATHHWWTVADSASRELQRIHASALWRMTHPLRTASSIAKRVRALSGRLRRWSLGIPGRVATPLAARAVRRALAHPGLKSRAVAMLANFPGLRAGLRHLAMRALMFDQLAPTGVAAQPSDASGSPAHLPPRAARIQADLRKAIEDGRSRAGRPV